MPDVTTQPIIGQVTFGSGSVEVSLDWRLLAQDPTGEATERVLGLLDALDAAEGNTYLLSTASASTALGTSEIE